MTSPDLLALDPAKPGFENHPPTHTLNVSDADYVEVYHSDMDMLGTGSVAMGHLDIFLNDGKFQPHCPSVSKGLIENGIANTIFTPQMHNSTDVSDLSIVIRHN